MRYQEDKMKTQEDVLIGPARPRCPLSYAQPRSSAEDSSSSSNTSPRNSPSLEVIGPRRSARLEVNAPRSSAARGHQAEHSA